VFLFREVNPAGYGLYEGICGIGFEHIIVMFTDITTDEMEIINDTWKTRLYPGGTITWLSAEPLFALTV